MMPMAQLTDLRAPWRSAPCKRIRMCGSPAVPRTSAMPSEMKSIFDVDVAPYLSPAQERRALAAVLRGRAEQVGDVEVELQRGPGR